MIVKFSVVLCALVCLTGQAVADDLTAKVNVFVGADGGGNTTPGAAVPFGFISFGPDTVAGNTSGYDSRSSIIGFAYTHVSGTGGASKFGNFRVTPTTGPLRLNNLLYAKQAEDAGPGYYHAIIGNDPKARIDVQLTATRLVGLSRITYPAGDSSHLITDVTSSIQIMGGGPKSTTGHVEVMDDHSLSGWATFEGGWNGSPYKLYFYAEYDRPAQAFGTWKAGRGMQELKPGVGTLIGGDQRQQYHNRVGAYATFDTRANPTVQMKLAVSFVSVDKAQANMEAELPGWDFAATRASADALWGQKLAAIEVSGGTEEQQKIFYSALYRSHIMPHDLTGENVWWASDEPYYDQFYTLWDTFRTLHPLFTVIAPERQRGMVRSLIDTYRHTGWLPDGRIAGSTGLTQGGSNADVVIADAVVKNLGGFDLKDAYAAILKDGDVQSDAPMERGRELTDYVRLGYVPLSQERSASRTLEYAYNDFAISLVAAKLGKTADAKRFKARSKAWGLLWDDGLQCIRPRYADGTWLENFDCAHEYPDQRAPWWDVPFYEGSSRQYSTYVPHDMLGLAARLGGAEGLTKWLDELFDKGFYTHHNEPDILAPYMYIAAGRPDKTADRVRHILRTGYRLSPNGLPGNDDAGAMSSWYVWSAIGLYPNAGQPYYFIGSPIFEAATLKLEGGKTFAVKAAGASDVKRYVTAAKLNGKLLERAWISHAELIKGGVLELEMSDKPGKWAQTFTDPAKALGY